MGSLQDVDGDRDPDIRDDPYYQAKERKLRQDEQEAKRLNDGFAMLNSEGILEDDNDDSVDE